MTTEAAEHASHPKRQRSFLVFLRDVLVIILIAALVSFVVKSFVVRSFYIPSGSMERTLLVNDRILVDELTPRGAGYERGDVVVFQDPSGWLPAAPQTPARQPLVEAIDWVLTLVGISATDSQDHLVKRIIGAPIDELTYLNLPEGDTAASNTDFDVTVPEGAIWVMGDNRDRSQDSRAHQELPGKGFVPLENVVGRAFLTTWPLDRFGLIDTHDAVYRDVPEDE